VSTILNSLCQNRKVYLSCPFKRLERCQKLVRVTEGRQGCHLSSKRIWLPISCP